MESIVVNEDGSVNSGVLVNTYKLVENTENGESMTYTGGVKVDESVVISEVSNVMAGDKLVIDKITIEHTKIENPLPNAYEGWKNFWLTDYLILS